MKCGLHHLLLFLLLAGLAMPAAGQDEPGLSGGRRTAVVLYISSDTIADLVVPVAEVRRFALEHLHAHLADAGHELLAGSRVDQAVGRWRVRGPWSISQTFLDHLAEAEGVGLLQVVHLQVGPTRLAMMVRQLDCPSGRLLGVAQPGADLGYDPVQDAPPPVGQWLATLAQLCRQAPVSTGAVPAGQPLLVLPTEGIACRQEHAMSATVSILARLMDTDQWLLPDPALVATTLSSNGVAPGRLGREGRALLHREFGADTVLRPALTAYGTGPGAAGPRAINFGESSPAPTDLSGFDLVLRKIELTTGTVTAGLNLYSPAETGEGWFGIRHHQTPQQRLDNAAALLWQRFRPQMEDR